MFVHLGRWMIWDQTGHNKDILTKDNFASDMAESILCDRSPRVTGKGWGYSLPTTTMKMRKIYSIRAISEIKKDREDRRAS
jgi:hypothetical protein